MKEIELTPKAEEDLEAIWDYSFRQFAVVQADAYIGRIAADLTFWPCMTSEHIARSWETYQLVAGGTAHDLFYVITVGGYDHTHSQPVSGYGAA